MDQIGQGLAEGEEVELRQLFRVENGKLRLLSSTCQVIEKPSIIVALRILKSIGFEQHFERVETSQYTGFRLPGLRGYVLILAQRKSTLCISFAGDWLEKQLLHVVDPTTAQGEKLVYRYWIPDSQKEQFKRDLSSAYPQMSLENLEGCNSVELPGWTQKVKAPYLIQFEADPLFPYALQSEILRMSDLQELLTEQGEALLQPEETISLPTNSKVSENPTTIFKEEIMDHFKLNCPNASENLLNTCETLTKYILQKLPGSRLGDRVFGSDSYTPIKDGYGRVVAAVDARKNFVKLDFRLPLPIAEKSKDNGELKIQNPNRRGGAWVQLRVEDRITLKRALELLDLGLSSELPS